MFETDGTIQPSLFAFTPRDLVKEDSDVWLYIDIFDNLDLLEFESSYCGQGQIAKDPRLMLRTIFYALTHGINSGRKLSEVCRNDNRFIVLCGQTQPDRRTFDRFLMRHEEALSNLFASVVQLAQSMGLVRLGRVAIDGTKFRAYASKQMRYEKMTPALDQIKSELEKLKIDLRRANSGESTERSEQLADAIKNREERIALIKRAKSKIEAEYERSTMKPGRKEQKRPKASKKLHDLDALSLGAGAKFPFGYNAQAAVDGECQIVVAAELSECASDSKSLPHVMDKVKEVCGENPDKILADNGYYSIENLLETKSRGSVPYISPNGEYQDVPLRAIEQISKIRNNHYCLNGLEHAIKTCNRKITILAVNSSRCYNCPFQSSCLLYGKKTCQISAGKDGGYLKNYLKRSRTPKFREIYKFRKAIVEPVFGNIKNKGHKLYRRGLRSVSIWWKMLCTAHNIEKIVKLGYAQI